MHPLDSSPSSDHFDMTGTFSEDDIQHLLGVMNSTSHEVGATSADHSSQVGVVVPNPVTQAAVDAAAAACLPPTTESNTANTASNEVDEEAKALARSERKRSREKQRRLDVNKQFTDLTTLVAKIEQEEREEDPTVFRQSFSATNRADLIARTVAHLERLREVNKRRKTECATLQQQLQESQKAGEEIAAKYKEAMCKNHGMGMMAPQNKPVMMMVPMMMPANAAQGMPQFGMQAAAPMCNQFMMPQQAFMPQPAAAAAAAPTVQVAQQQQQAPAQQQSLQHAPQHAQAPQPQAPAPAHQQMAMPTMMTPQQMMFTSMQSVYPMVDPNATNAAMAAATPQQQQQQQQPQQMAMPFNFMAPPTAPVAAAPATSAPAEPKTGDDVQQAPSQQQQQQQPPSNGQGNSSSAGGSNYAHCA